MDNQELKDLLDEKAFKYNQPDFIETDPIQVPKQFARKENIEIAAFLSAGIAWGQRPVIIKNALDLVKLMDHDPFEFLMHSGEQDWQRFSGFKHRTFNGIDCLFFLRSLKNIYKNHGGLEAVFTRGYQSDRTIESALRYFRKIFFGVSCESRSQKHISDIDKGSSAKRLNMFLRWMVRSDEQGVDFGLWKAIPMSSLMLPLDVHTGTQSRQLGLLTRKQNDWKAVLEVTATLRQFDPFDPVKYDFALFGMGVFEQAGTDLRG
ncbi:MAG: TIGR02757 family protein [Mangrovibacterium sp.]